MDEDDAFLLLLLLGSDEDRKDYSDDGSESGDYSNDRSENEDDGDDVLENEDAGDDGSESEDAISRDESQASPPRKRRTERVMENPVKEEMGGRDQLGEFSTHFAEEILNAGAFHAANRMTPTRFEELLTLVGHRLECSSTASSQPIPAAEMLALTLRYMASGQSQQDIARSFRVGQSTASNVIMDVCTVLWEELAAIEMKTPTQDDWLAISKGFKERWHFPHCLGAIGGKLINVKRTGSLFHDDSFSTVLLAVTDADYCFTLVDVGEYDIMASVMTNSALGKDMDNGALNIPIPPGDGLGYVLLGDEAFPLRGCLMRPYPGRGMVNANRDKRTVFNYRLYHGRKVIENTFGILMTKWRIFLQPAITDVVKVDVIVKAATVLHNFLRRRDRTSAESLPYIGPDDLDVEEGGELRGGSWRSQCGADAALRRTGRLGSNNASRGVIALRDRFAAYFVSPEGEVPGQDWVVG